MTLKIAFTTYGLHACIGARYGRGIDALPVFGPIHTGCLIYWHRGTPDRIAHLYDCANVQVNLRQLAQTRDSKSDSTRHI